VIYRTNHALDVTWGPRATPLSEYKTTVPEGHRCRLVKDNLGRRWFFAEPAGLGLEGIALHDAIHYGIHVHEADISTT